MIKSTLLAGLAVIFSLAVSSAETPKGTQLRLDMQPGKTHILNTDMSIIYFSDAKLTEEVMNLKTTTTLHYKVLDQTEEGIHTIEAELIRIIADQKAQGMGLQYDSDKPETAQGMGAMMAQQFAPVLKKPVTFKVNNIGEIVEKPEEPEGAQSGAITMNNLIENLFMEMPEQAISKGDTWVKDENSQVMGKVSVKLTYTVEDMSSSEVVLAYKADSEDINIEGAEAETMDGMDLKMGGKAIFDRKTGKMLSNTLNQSIKANDPQMGEFFMVTTIKQTSKS